MSKQWQVVGSDAPMLSGEALKDMLFVQRGVEDAEAFMAPRYDRDVHDPYALHTMGAAVERVYQARDNDEHVVVYGDYDADGVTSAAIVVTLLERLGVQVTPFLPHRAEHGYGLNKDVVQEMAGDIGVVITVDCGISNASEVNDLQAAGVDTIIIDHHTIPDVLPAAHAIIHVMHPDGQYSYDGLCGAGTAWKFAQAVLRDSRSPAVNDPDAEKWLLDFAALGTIADLVPLTGENRAIVQFGLEVLRRSPRPGIQALLSAARVELSSLSAKDLSWRAIPLLNAAGRMDHAQPALELLLATTSEQAETALAAIKQLDAQRRAATKQVVTEASAQIDMAAPVAFAHSESWPAGVVGLAANKLLKEFGKPALVVGNGGAEAVGSVRTPEAVNAVDLLASVEGLLVKYGGHARAAGFTVSLENLEAFATDVQASAAKWEHEKESQHVADAVLDEALLTMDTADLLKQFAPFGKGNEEPHFIVRGLTVVDWRPVGKSGDHAKVTFKANEQPLDGIAFGIADLFRDDRLVGKKVDVFGELEVNEWRGRKQLQFAVQDIAQAGTVRITSTTHEQARNTS